MDALRGQLSSEPPTRIEERRSAGSSHLCANLSHGWMVGWVGAIIYPGGTLVGTNQFPSFPQNVLAYLYRDRGQITTFRARFDRYLSNPIYPWLLAGVPDVTTCAMKSSHQPCYILVGAPALLTLAGIPEL